jgi:integrase
MEGSLDPVTLRQKALTDAGIRALDAPASGSRDVADLRVPGLFLVLTANGARSWTFRFTDPVSGKRLRFTFARYPDLSLAAARDRAEELRTMVARGINPIGQRKQDREEASAKLFEALAQRYLDEHANRFKRSAGDDQRMLRLHILPKWGNRTFASITRADVIALVEGLIKAGTPGLANRVQALVSKIFSFALDCALIENHPAARLKKRAPDNVHSRVLDDHELRLFWNRITPVSPRVGTALKLALLTGLRASEVAGIHKSEILHLDDPDQAALLIPGERVKNKRPHLVPLSPLSRDLVLEAMKLAGEGADYLFPGRNVADNNSTDRHALAKAMGRFAEALPANLPGAKTWKADAPAPHDLRRTAATRLSWLGVSKEDRDAVLNHISNDVGSRHYDMYARHREKRVALSLWATTLATILAGTTNVVPLKKRGPKP